MFFKKNAYTLAEIVIVMLVIAVVVGVCIKISKVKMDNILKVEYYVSYDTLKTVTTEMLKDYEADDENYMSMLFPVAHAEELDKNSYYYCAFPHRLDFFYDSDGSFSNFNFGLDSTGSGVIYACLYNTNSCQRSRLLEHVHAGQLTKDPLTLDCSWLDGYKNSPKCPGKFKYPSGTFQIKHWKANYQTEYFPTYPQGYIPNEGGSQYEKEECSFTCNDGVNYNCGNASPDVIYKGFSCYGDKEFAPINKERGWIETSQDNITTFHRWPVCIGDFGPIEQDLPTIPRKGKNFCKLFVSYSNTSPSLIDGGEECKGDGISDSLTDFSDKKPDIVLRNGMILYNMSKDPVEIHVLKGNSRNKKYTKADETEVDIDEWGYVVYIDIDGKKGGEGKLWEDVYPFYITLSGTLIPAYDSANAGEFGGDSAFHLQTSVMDIYTDATTGQATRWVTKSASFKESACTMGIVKTTGENTYCNGVEADVPCTTDDSHDCKLKIITPVKFFN